MGNVILPRIIPGKRNGGLQFSGLPKVSFAPRVKEAGISASKVLAGGGIVGGTMQVGNTEKVVQKQSEAPKEAKVSDVTSAEKVSLMSETEKRMAEYLGVAEEVVAKETVEQEQMPEPPKEIRLTEVKGTDSMVEETKPKKRRGRKSRKAKVAEETEGTLL